jgi:topoisomerase-4 subunit B
MDPDTRRLVRLSLDAEDGTDEVMDMLLSKKRAADRKNWLESKGNMVELEV